MKKDVVLVILVLLCVGLLTAILAITQKENKTRKNLEEERYIRMVTEERLEKSDAKLTTLEVQLKTANEKMSKVQDLMDQQKEANTDLQKQYEELGKIKADLEVKLKSATTPAAP